MKVWFLCVWLIIPTAHSHSDGAVPQKQPKCKNPKGNLRSSLLDKDCGVSVCKKKGNKGVWEKCPRPATQDKLQEMEKTMLSTLNTLEEKIDDQFGSRYIILEEMEKMMSSAFKTLEEKIDNQCSSSGPSLEIGCNGKQGWSRFDSSCYKLFDNNGSGFENRDACQKECKGWEKLTSIRSKYENDFLASLLKWNGNGLSAFVGADEVSPKEFEWIDGSEWNYDNWAEGYPDGKQGCVVLGEKDRGKWIDAPCDYAKACICREDIPEIPIGF